MARITVAAPAKLNIFLDITGKRNDGYHLLNTVMQSVSLYDDVTVTVDDDGDEISISCTDPEIPCDKTNTAYIAAEKFFEYTGIKQTGVSVKIKKRIPSQAGMAGGSTDAAAVLFALNELLDAGLDREQLAEIAEQVGADVPFCIYGGTMSATGIGNIFSPLPDMPDCTIVAVRPGFRVSTREAYERSDAMGYQIPKSSDGIIAAICSGSIKELAGKMYNRFEELTDEPELPAIKQKMKECGALGELMTGSGSVIFSIFDDEDKAQHCRDELHDISDSVYVFRPDPQGQRQISTGIFSALFD